MQALNFDPTALIKMCIIKCLSFFNRRLFHVCTFFLFFFNIFLGVVSCLKRIIIGAVLGVMFLGRTQKSVISRDFELMDPGSSNDFVSQKL